MVTPAIASCMNANNRSGANRQQPNIILMMADDMGFSDIGCYGGEIDTPNLNKLGENGLRFTQFYNTARCCPARASLMSGLYPHQTGVGHMMEDRGYKSYRGELSKGCVTIAEVLKESGYSTYMSGKWHLTKFIGPNDDKSNWPCQRGFDRFFGTIHGAGSYFDPNSLTRNNTQIAPPSEDFYYTDAISDNASKFIRQHKGNNPFFLYVAFTAPHWPMQARERDIAKYKGRYRMGWDRLRAERYDRMVKMGIIDSKWKITPRDEDVSAWDQAKDKKWLERRMEVYAAMVDCLDQGVGRIVEAVKETGQFDNTLILFLSDNGGCAEEFGSTGPVTPEACDDISLKPMGKEELQTRMVPKVTRDGRLVRRGYGIMPGGADTYIAYGKGWANSSNTPFRLYKHWVHEGGISSPLVAHWPGGIRARGELRSQPAHLIDIMATCVELSQAHYPGAYKGHKICPMEGKSLVGVFSNEQIDREGLYWEHEGNRAVRKDDWKLVSKYPGRWELYNLKADRTELNNLAEREPAKAAELKAMWEKWAKRIGVQPWPVKKKVQKKKGRKEWEGEGAECG